MSSHLCHFFLAGAGLSLIANSIETVVVINGKKHLTTILLDKFQILNSRHHRMFGVNLACELVEHKEIIPFIGEAITTENIFVVENK